MEFGLKWVHMARCELILRLDGALWLTIIFKPLLTQERANNTSHVHRARHYQNPLYQQKARAHNGIIKKPQKSKKSSRAGQACIHPAHPTPPARIWPKTRSWTKTFAN